jgi:hypothetical protein
MAATLFGAINDDANRPIVKLTPSGTPRVWSLVTAAGVIDFEANNRRTVGVRVRGCAITLMRSGTFALSFLLMLTFHSRSFTSPGVSLDRGQGWEGDRFGLGTYAAV